MCRKSLVFLLACGLLFAPVSQLSAQSHSSQSVVLSISDYDAIVAEIEAAKLALAKSSEKILQQSRDLRTLYLASNVLALAVVIETVALIVTMTFKADGFNRQL